MECKDCRNFKTEKKVEAGSELSPQLKEEKGKCTVIDKGCSATDSCSCGEFSCR